MCKVLMVAGIKKKHQEKLKNLLGVAAEIMGRSEDDGVGYAAITTKGKIYGEKWLNKDDAFKIHAQPKIKFSQLFMDELLGDAAKWKANSKVTEDIVYGRFGSLTQEAMDDTVAVILHARKKTEGDKSIVNTHPFYIIDDKKQEDVALIHNGSISNHAALTKKFSNCDSEVILHEYVKNFMNYNPWGIEEVARTLKGQYTVGVLSSQQLETGEITPHLDIFKYKKDLHAAYFPELEAVVFSTWSSTLEEIGRKTGLALENIIEVKDEFLIRINAITGERMEDLIPFTGKDREIYPYGANGWSGHHSNSPNQSPPELEGNVGPVDIRNRNNNDDDIEETIETAKGNFEHAHSEIFTSKYYTPNGLTEPEKAFMDSLAAADNTNLKALRLVQKVLGIPVKA